MRILDQRGLVAGAGYCGSTLRGEGLAAPPGGDRVKPDAPRLAEILDVLPFVVDVLAERSERVEAFDGAVDRGIDVLSG